jgi:hypothetical protein
MTMSLPLWLRVSSEYPSSNLFALIEEAGRKGCMYGGPENWAAGLPSGPAMLGCGGVEFVAARLCATTVVVCGDGSGGRELYGRDHGP